MLTALINLPFFIPFVYFHVNELTDVYSPHESWPEYLILILMLFQVVCWHQPWWWLKDWLWLRQCGYSSEDREPDKCPLRLYKTEDITVAIGLLKSVDSYTACKEPWISYSYSCFVCFPLPLPFSCRRLVVHILKCQFLLPVNLFLFNIII